MKLKIFLLSFVLWSLSTAMSVLPPSLDDLVDRAETVAQTEVVSVVSEWSDSASGRVIVTKVRIRLDVAIKGPEARELELVQLGGTVGSQSMVISGAPVWRVGDRDVLFIAQNRKSMFPLVAVSYGRYPIVKEARTGKVVVTRANGEPLHSVDEIENEMNPPDIAAAKSSLDGSLSLPDFTTAITRKLQQSKAKSSK